MAEPTDPAPEIFFGQLTDRFVFVEVVFLRRGDAFVLRHVADTDAEAGSLTVIDVSDLRALAQTTCDGAFRPNKAAPNLRRGWQSEVSDPARLEAALRHLYPGGLADWAAARPGSPPVTHYRETAARQTGLYRITQILPDALAAKATRACCDAGSCLRRRLWTAPGAEADPEAAKSVLPCLEPCALLLDLARRAMKLEQGPKADLQVAEDDVPVLVHALRTALAHPVPEIREGDTGSPCNPRRLRLLLEKLGPLMPAAPAVEAAT
ncbi:MAG: DR2241 family protein [Deltaproteobacteria bacterium]